MPKFEKGQRVRLVIKGKVTDVGTIDHVGLSCLYCVDDNDNRFHSHIENFVSAELDEVPAATRNTFVSDEMVENATRLVPRQVPDTDDAQRWVILRRNAPPADTKKPIVIGIAGRRGHGKDTSAQALTGFENVKFAGPIKAMARAFFSYVGMDAATIDRVVDGDMKETPLACLGDKTSRYLQQVIGTEMGRDLIWDRIWINAAKMRAAQFPKVAITDLRFPNEGVAITEEMGGVTMRVRNPRITVVTGEHSSEDLVDTLPVQFDILNDGTIEDLHEKVRAVLVASGVSKRYVEQF
jgi:hypothetical protein